MEMSIDQELKIFAQTLPLEVRELFQDILRENHWGALIIYLRSRGMSWAEMAREFNAPPSLFGRVMKQEVVAFRCHLRLEDIRFKVFGH